MFPELFKHMERLPYLHKSIVFRRRPVCIVYRKLPSVSKNAVANVPGVVKFAWTCPNLPSPAAWTVEGVAAGFNRLPSKASAMIVNSTLV
jgi:hypothetical protein